MTDLFGKSLLGGPKIIQINRGVLKMRAIQYCLAFGPPYCSHSIHSIDDVPSNWKQIDLLLGSVLT